MRVLVCEDTPEIAEMLRFVLSMAGADVTIHTTDFEELFDPAEWAGVDVALIDLMLGGVDGEDIVRYLADHVPTVRRVVLSAVAHQREGLSELATVISKPVEPSVLTRALGLREEPGA